VSWNQGKAQVEMTEAAGRGLLAHLEAVAGKGGFPDLSQDEMAESFHRLSLHLVGNRQKTGPKTLPAIVLGWLENDLRAAGRRKQGRRSPAQAQAAEEQKTEAERGKGVEQRIARCEYDNGPHTKDRLKVGGQGKFLYCLCGYREPVKEE
jgi:hypothetical protein